MATATASKGPKIQEGDALAMSPKVLIEYIKMMYAARVPVCMWGAPGIGKSSIALQVTQQMNVKFIDIRVAQMEPTDARGIPYVKEGRTFWATPEMFPSDGEGIILLDELNRGPVGTQNAFLQLVRERRLGEFKLGDGWMVIAACNRETDGGGVHRMTDALADRFNHQVLVADHGEWCEWALTTDINPMTLAFIRTRPELLHVYDSKSKQRVFPTPRSWEHVSDISKQIAGAHKQMRQFSKNVYAGSVGEGAAIEYVAFEDMFHKLPSIDQILMNPGNVHFSQDPSALCAVASAVGRVCNQDNIGRVIEFLERLPLEYNIMGMRDAMVRDDSIMMTPEFGTWAMAHKDVTIGR